MGLNRYVLGASACILASFGVVHWALRSDNPEEAVNAYPREELSVVVDPSTKAKSQNSPILQEEKGTEPAHNQSIVPSPAQDKIKRQNEESNAGPIRVVGSAFRKELALQSKDQWSYKTEQAIAQFFASHPRSTEFDIQTVDCRLTGCVIQAIAFDQSAILHWREMSEQMRQQPWSEFGMVGTAATEGQGPVPVSMTMRRRAN